METSWGSRKPLLGPLANNGGPTETVALLAGSPAIDAGSETIAGVTIPGVDQRGVARPTTGIDIGAYQSVGLVATPASTGSSSSQSINTITTPAVVHGPTSTSSVVSTLLTKKAKDASKLKVAPKKTHPGGGSAVKFHKSAAPKPKKHVALSKAHSAAKAHPAAEAHLAAHAKKK